MAWVTIRHIEDCRGRTHILDRKDGGEERKNERKGKE